MTVKEMYYVNLVETSVMGYPGAKVKLIVAGATLIHPLNLSGFER